MKYLFLRGFKDERTAQSIIDDDCVWTQLFAEMVGPDDYGLMLYLGESDRIQYKNNFHIGFLPPNLGTPAVFRGNVDIVFARGGFPEYVPFVKACPKAFKIYYGAGRRFIPQGYTDYDLILADSQEQKDDINRVLRDKNVQLFIKPAARHFKPLEREKKYDVCFIANGQQAAFKGVKWVYDTVPKDLKILHLGYPSKFEPPENITCKRVSRIKMANEINNCKIGIVPYWNKIDSCPRIIPEMLACGLPIVVADELRFWKKKYMQILATKEDFWKSVKETLKCNYETIISNYYNDNLSLPIAAKHIKDMM